MAIGRAIRNCTIVLHDDHISKDDILCGINVLSADEVGLLIAPNAKTLCISPISLTKNGDEVSVHTSVARRFGFENRTKGKVQVLENEDDAVATHVEITFRDQHLSRADMWRMKAETEDRVVYKGQKLKYLGSTAAEVANLYIAGPEVDSAIVSHPRTRLIFRSYSARYTILIQISKEMLQYWRGGDLLFERLVSGFLPNLFTRWEQMKVHHQVTIILFGRKVSRNEEDGNTVKPTDFFHVLVSETAGADWRALLRKLQKTLHDGSVSNDVCMAAEGNLLEAIHLTAMDFADDNLAPPASSAGTSIIAITAGAGLFKAQHKLLKKTTELLLGNSIGVDIVSLSPKPLHPVPLFQYDLSDNTEYALPHWLDISFWAPPEEATHHWLLPDGNENAKRVALPRLAEECRSSITAEVMASHDQGAFEDSDEEENVLEKTISHETTIEASNPSASCLPEPMKPSSPLNGVATVDMQPQPSTKATPRTSTDATSPAPQPTASVPLTNRAKREALPPHPLMQNFRKISLGPKGLAPSQSVASTTVSAHHVQHERDLSTTAAPARENPSLLAKQIRESLRKRPSQRTLVQHQMEEPSESSKPIVIRTSEEIEEGSEALLDKSDPASLIEKAILDGDSGPNSGSYSATPRTKRGSLPLPGLSSIDTQDGSNTPWLTLLNPCDPRRDNMRIASEYRKWQNVFPRAISSGSFKWDSMCSPATLPLMTEVRVSMTDLDRHFTKKVRRMLVTPSISSKNDDAAQDVLHQLVALRLAAGFQIVPTRKLRREQTANDNIEKIVLALGSYYHEIRQLSQAEIQVTEYERPKKSMNASGESEGASNTYNVNMRSILSRKDRAAHIGMDSNPFVQDWAALDDQCANPAAATDDQGVCRMRFVLIPVKPTNIERTGLSDEERRIEGIQRLTLMWQRHRYLEAGSEKQHAFMVKPSGSKVERDPNPLAIEYQTRDPSTVVNGLATVGDSGAAAGETGETDVFHSNNFDLTKLVKLMQQAPPDGIELRDRRWFTRMHFKCFRGDEMCNWILRVFKDLHTREDAAALGNQLMDREIFTHVRGKHEFRDGHYLYQIKGAYRTTDYPDNAGLFSKGIGRSMPSTPLVEMKQSPSMRAAQAESDSSSSSKGTPTPTSAPMGRKERKSILLTEKLRYNVDPNKKSSQLEVIDLHYDRIHNPDNCYHIQLDWTNATPKLIRESVARWSSAVDGHGLRLVQLPMKEVCRMHEQHPFDQAVPVKLAFRPPKKVPATPLLVADGASPATASDDPLAGHKALLRKLDFVLDLESATSFPKTVDVSYSWGKPDFELTQFIHQSGLLLVQIANGDEADFLLLPNRLAPHTSSSGRKGEITPSLDDIVAKVKAFCRDAEALKTVYNDFNKPRADLSSPFARADQAADIDVPAMELPPLVVRRSKG